MISLQGMADNVLVVIPLRAKRVVRWQILLKKKSTYPRTFDNFANQNDKVSFKGTIGELAWLPFQKLIEF